MKTSIAILLSFFCIPLIRAQVPVDLQHFSSKNGATVTTKGNILTVQWPTGIKTQGRLLLNLGNGQPLFNQIQLVHSGIIKSIAVETDPAFVLTIGKRDLISQNGWNIFFDKVPLKPFHSHVVTLHKKAATVKSMGSRTVVGISDMEAPGFKGRLEITLYNGSPLFNVAAVLSTQTDSTAIVYDAGLTTDKKTWDSIAWADVYDHMQGRPMRLPDTAINEAVKYRTIIGKAAGGSIAVFPAPHQYFYPLDEAFNLKFTWHGNHYRQMLNRYGIGIRQDLYGDRRYVPWFNAPPGTEQRLNFFCFISTASPAATLEQVKRYTHNDSYVALDGYQTMSSHFHNEFTAKVVLAGKPIPEVPSFVSVFKKLGVNIVHLGEFHGPGHPRGPDSLRLRELQALFQQCERLSDNRFLLLPGEEPNNFLGGHWLGFFPTPVYWVMSRKDSVPFVSNDPVYGKVYHIGNAKEMLDLLNTEKGLAWTAHPRTKGSTGFPDRYKTEPYFLSDRFLGAAWKPMPADLSRPELGKRVLDLLDDMNNWGVKKKVLAEADIFTIEQENEMYAHMNVNYLQLPKLPGYKDGWQPVLDVLEQGKFFSTTGEVLIPYFTVDKKQPGETIRLSNAAKTAINFNVQWTFPLHFAEIISGDGKNVFRHRINLEHTQAFGRQTIQQTLDLTGRTWVRLEVWDVAANGAFTQTVWLQ
jgi:hypothetical protein